MKETIYYNGSIQSNKQKLGRVRDISSLALGVGCGILALESLVGFGFYIVGTTLTNLLFIWICCGSEPSKFFVSPKRELLLEGVVENVPGFVMMWCLVYAIVS
ncbi:uncharacterized protein CANTADRAFT_52832 [Suhomyces tanzawaensis NRRL Y-17324]|uniref:ER membrane protein complex subunit 6 n=1 Tax=Suhomyces tanzawaensis NRRL Y-17324 TaxID=984487 RepID=A0A1E4SFX3_9ASCO|nr:uncharacterized protein CANTADRAFT_52832 [Suhomyces tanzawaensis NRRL Y-17324]ODV78407.1 hypothetical protein CANTADRAFT_52832 [Suhomyces tanzawaensis NRRL Y-17324]